MQILKGLYQVGGDLMGLTYDGVHAGYNDCNTYILEKEDGLIMFDSGCGDTIEQIFENMKYWSLNPDDIKYCILTHPHFDHAAGAYYLKQNGVIILALNETADAVSKGDERTCPYLYHKAFKPYTVDKIVANGEIIDLLETKIEVIHLPGHSMGCTAYLFNHQRKKILISGDVIGTLLDGYHGWSGSIDFNKQIYLDSLLKFSKVDADIMLPGHGMVYFHKPKHRIEEALNVALVEWR